MLRSGDGVHTSIGNWTRVAAVVFSGSFRVLPPGTAAATSSHYHLTRIGASVIVQRREFVIARRGFPGEHFGGAAFAEKGFACEPIDIAHIGVRFCA